MTEHWPDPVAIGGEALLHFLLPEQCLFTIGAGEAAMADGAVWGLLKEAVKHDGLHGRKGEWLSPEQTNNKPERAVVSPFH